MYQALYRKYRPKNFNEIVGQDVIVKTLKNAIEKNKISHAYLFTGPRGTGKTSTAKIFAKTINCKNIKDGNSCEECECCKLFNEQQNIDIIEIDAASNNGVDEIRELKNKVNLVPSFSKYKVYIIDEVHMLSTSAFNALLKTLEEPPSHIIFILATTDPHKVLPTILSRCQRFDFKKVSEDNLYSNLKRICDLENIKITDKALKEISRIANGGMRDALSILDQVIAFSENEIDEENVHEINGTITQNSLKEFVENIINGNLEKIYDYIDVYDNSGKNFIKIVEELILFFKNILIINKCSNLFNDSEIKLYSEFNNIIDNNKIISIIEILNDSLISMKNNNNSRLIFELIVIKIINFLDNKKEVINVELNKEEKIVIKNDEKISDDLFIEFQNRRVENTLSKFSKKILLDYKNKFNNLKENVEKVNLNNTLSLLIDAELKAASDEYFIFVLQSDNSKKIFNKNIINLEKIIQDEFNVLYKIIGLSIDEWDKIKDIFNNKKKQFNYIKEDFDYSKIFNISNYGNNESSIDSMFKNIVEYK